MFFREKKEENWRIIEKVNKMSDEEILEKEKSLYIQSGIITFLGLILLGVGILLIVLLF